MHKYVPSHLQGKTDQELLDHYDDPRNFEVKDSRNIPFNQEFPDHVIVMLTHGSFAINSKIRSTLVDVKDRTLTLLKNFSDFGTRLAIKKSGIPKDNIITHTGSRAIADPARPIDPNEPKSEELIRETDFSGNKILENPNEHEIEGKRKHAVYHSLLWSGLFEKEVNNGGVIGFDFHDTGVNKMGLKKEDDRFKEDGFPPMILSTLNGEACDPEILEYFAQRIKHWLGIDSVLNEKFLGGYVTKLHGADYRKELKERNLPENKRNIIQIELGRYLYMKESTQEVDWERMEIIGEGLKRAMAETGEKFGPEYFKAGKFGDNYNKKDA